MTTSHVKYRYSMSLKIGHLVGRTPIQSVFPNPEDIIISSKHFDEFEQAVTSANALVTEMALNVNASINEERYGLISEVNPSRSGQETISKDWGDAELVKLWVIDKIHREENPGPIKAVGLAQILEVPAQPMTVN